jgi:hypothetical protein
MAAPMKQATMYVVDLGSTMGECHSGRTESDLDYGMRYIWDKIAITMAANLKGGNLGVIGFRTNETDNPLDDDDGYKNISVSTSLASGGPSSAGLTPRHVPPRRSNNICASRITISHTIPFLSHYSPLSALSFWAFASPPPP